MSRIVGWFGQADDPSKDDRVKRMLDACRLGSDWKSAAFGAGPISLGWCGWRSPNAASTGRVIVVMDGFIYNRAELGGAEAGKDAALFAALFERHGMEESLRRINGDVAVAVFDRESQTLWLGCDRFRTRPLYYSSLPDGFAFASQPRALLAIGVSGEPNRQSVAVFAGSHYRYIDNDPEGSFLAAISSLPAAHVLRVSTRGITKRCFWNLRGEDLPGTEEELTEQCRSLILDSVDLRLKSAERPAFTLSGGLDSASVLGCVVNLTGARQTAFSGVYVDKTYDESEEIQSMLEPAVEKWHPVVVDQPDVFGLVERMIAVHDEPVATATWLSHFLLCERTAQAGFGGLFGGLGSDELNAGEYEHFWYFFADLKQAGDTERLAQEVTGWIRHHDHPIFRKDAALVERMLGQVTDLARPGVCRPDRTRLERYAATLNPGYFDLRSFEPVMDNPFRSYLKNRTFQDLTRETVPCCLRAEDRQTIAFGIDNFLPFLDYRLVEFMFRVPVRLKYRDGVTKWMLRGAMRGILPEETRCRIKKVGWNAPAHRWFSGRGRERLMDLIRSRRFRDRGIYNVEEVTRLADEHEEIVTGGLKKDNHMMFFWQVVNLEMWFRHMEEFQREQSHESCSA